MRSSSGELASSPTKREPPRSVSPTKNRRSEAKQDNRARMNRSYSTPDGTKKSPRGSQKDVRRSSDDIKLAKSSVKRRSLPAAEDVVSDHEEENKARNGARGKKASSTSNLASVEVPENKLSDRGARGSRSSSRDGRSRNSVNINDDSYEIIEMEDEEEESSQRDKLTAREKIEQELAEQIQREEELKQAHVAVKPDDDDGESEEEGGVVEQEKVEEEVEQDSSDEDQKLEEPKLSTWEKIALEIEEEKKREEEVKQRVVKQEEESGDSGEGEEEEEAGIEIEEEQENQPLDVSTKINLEIEEQIRREEELRSVSRAGGEDIEQDIEQDIEEDSGEDSPEEEQEKVVSVQDRIEMEIKEIEKREKELKKTYQAEVVVDEVEADEGIEEVESEPAQDEARLKIQQEIDEFKQKESEIRKLHGIDDSDESGEDSGGEGKFAGLSVIEREIKEQKQREREYRKQHMREQIPDDEGEKEEEIESADDGADEEKNADADDYEDDEIPEDESMLIEMENKKKAVNSTRNKGTRNKGETSRGGKSKEELSVTPGIARRFIHMFDKGGDAAKTPNKDESRESPMKNKKGKNKKEMAKSVCLEELLDFKAYNEKFQNMIKESSFPPTSNCTKIEREIFGVNFREWAKI